MSRSSNSSFTNYFRKWQTRNWQPQRNANATTNYTFVPAFGQCAVASNLTININSIAAVTGAQNQSFGSNCTIGNLAIVPSNVIWFATAADALANINPLSLSTTLADGTTYYAVNDNGQCRSQPFAVTTTVNLSVKTINRQSLKFYPNPVTSVLQIAYNKPINAVEIYNLLGQILKSETHNSGNVQVNLSDLASSIYLVKIKSENKTGEFKIVKQ